MGLNDTSAKHNNILVQIHTAQLSTNSAREKQPSSFLHKSE